MSQLDEETTGAYGGLGIEVLYLDGALRVISPIDDTPASRAGIKPGDVILRIDGKVVSDSEGNISVDALRGKPGSPIGEAVFVAPSALHLMKLDPDCPSSGS
jgi:carboxyl-terminal processing protease